VPDSLTVINVTEVGGAGSDRLSEWSATEVEIYRHLWLAEVEPGYELTVRDLRLGWPVVYRGGATAQRFPKNPGLV
jgi:hypothetical protein